jgi:hypothetical protein
MRIFSAIALIFLTFAILQPASAQYGRQRGGRSSGPTGASRAKQGAQPEDVLPNFTGVLTSIDKKKLTIEGEENNSLDFNCTKKTKYFNAAKNVGASNLKLGDHVSVEARRAPDGTLDAVNVRIEMKKPEQPQ